MTHLELVAGLLDAGWVDSSYGNDACPSLGYGWTDDAGWALRLWTDDADYDLRESGGPRYTLVRGGDMIGDAEQLWQGDSASEAFSECDNAAEQADEDKAEADKRQAAYWAQSGR